MTGEAARQRFLDWLDNERRAAALTVEAYGTDLADFLGFLTGHLGAEPVVPALAALRQPISAPGWPRGTPAGLAAPTRARKLCGGAQLLSASSPAGMGVENPAIRLVSTPRSAAGAARRCRRTTPGR